MCEKSKAIPDNFRVDTTLMGMVLLFCLVFFQFTLRVSVAAENPENLREKLAHGETMVVTEAEKRLADLEPLVKTSAAVLAKVARLEELLAILEYERLKSGWKIVGHVRGGYMDEQLTNDDRRQYYPSQLSAGLSYPLLGKRQEEKSNLLELETGTQNEGLRIAIKQLDALESLRLSYSLLWGAELKAGLADAFLQDREHYLALLQKRVDTGHLLRADYLEFVSALDLAVRERAVNLSTASRARDLIHALTGIELETPLAYPPDLPAACEQLDEAVAELATNPEILLYQNNVELDLERLSLSSDFDIEADLTVRGIMGTSEYVFSDYGYGGMVSLNFSLPLNPFAAGSSSKKADQQRLRRHQRELQDKTEELKIILKDRFRRRAAERENIQFARTRLQAATELLREKTLRADHIDGDVLEQLQHARFNYYRVSVDYIEAEIRLLNSSARVLRFCPANNEQRLIAGTDWSVIKPLYETSEAVTATLPVLEPQPLLDEQKSALAVYLWRSKPYIDGTNSVELFKEKKIGRVLISLNGEQIRGLQSEENVEELQKLLLNCRIAGISPGILLGEPTWILPEYRKGLLEILQRLNAFSLDRIHLDLEPSQLDVEEYGLAYLSAQLLRTVQLATEVSDHPVEISIHPRLLSVDETGFCFGCGLSNLELERVVLMIYRTDIANVRRQMSAFAKNYPYLNLAVAQSVETILGPKNSYANLGMEALQQSLQLLMTEDDLGWRGDVYIQDWVSYQRLAESSRNQGQQGDQP